MITRCPACSTAFKVSSQQLASAKGAVRCGSCLQVFKASEHLSEDTSSPKKTTQAELSTEPASNNEAPSSTPQTSEAPSEQERSLDQYAADLAAAKTASIDEDFNHIEPEFSEQNITEQNDLEPEVEATARFLDELANEETPSLTELNVSTEEPTSSENKATELDIDLSEIGDIDLNEVNLSEPPTEEPRVFSSATVQIDTDEAEIDSSFGSDNEPSTTINAVDDSESEEQTQSEAEWPQAGLDIEAPNPGVVLAEDPHKPSASTEETRYIDDDTRDFEEHSAPLNSLSPAITSEPNSEDEEAQDESWAVNMMIQELEGDGPNPKPSDWFKGDETSHELEAAPEETTDVNLASYSAGTDEDPKETLSPEGQEPIAVEADQALTIDSSLFADSGAALGEPPAGDELSLEAELDAAESDNRFRNGITEAQTQSQQDESSHLSAVQTSDTEPEELSKAEMIDRIEPEPLEVQFKAGGRSYTWLWAVASVLAALCLFAQFAWVKFPDLNRIEPYRSWYGIACQSLNCQLPPQVNLAKLKASNLVVRSHPSASNALVVDMVLLNTATFQQKFPSIQLSFSNLEGRVVASRVFSPAEYLAGELAGASHMPIKRPIHLSLEITDPGSAAVNYQVKVI